MCATVIFYGLRFRVSRSHPVLDVSELHFVRCFKPNDAKAPKTWSNDTVTRQLHTSGVLDALRVARTGYPDRVPYSEFVGTFAALAKMPKTVGKNKDTCKEMCSKLGVKQNEVSPQSKRSPR